MLNYTLLSPEGDWPGDVLAPAGLAFLKLLAGDRTARLAIGSSASDPHNRSCKYNIKKIIQGSKKCTVGLSSSLWSTLVSK